MRHFPIYLDTRNRTIVVSGAGDCAVAKLRLLLKTEARIAVFGAVAAPQVAQWGREGRLEHTPRALGAGDLTDAALLYAANDDPTLDRAAATLGAAAGVKTLIVDNLDDSDFITPAIVDRAPVTVAIGTEGAAPVLARRIKADVEAMLPASLGVLARIGRAFRPEAARLGDGRARRAFWSRFYFDVGPKALATGEEAASRALPDLLAKIGNARPEAGRVDFVGAGPGDPELLTLRARRLLHEADVVIHDRLISEGVLDLARREAEIIEVGKIPFGPSWRQDDINALLVAHAREKRVVRLKSGDSGVFGRLEEELEALDAAGVAYAVTPGVTTASAAAAVLNRSLTSRGRNSSLRLITGHEAQGFAEHDWRDLASPGAVAAVYMGKAAATFLRGRLLMHGADPATPVTVIENVSRTDQKILPASLLTLPDILQPVEGPAILMLGLAPRDARRAMLKEAL